MRSQSSRAATAAAIALVAVAVAFASTPLAAELKVLSAGGVRAVVTELGQQFERGAGHKVTIKFVEGPLVKIN